MDEILLFNKWPTGDVEIRDLGLAKYINLDAKIIPHTFGKGNKRKFDKGNISIVERLVNKLMRSGQGKRKLSGKYIRGRNGCGKKLQAMQIIEDAFDKINFETKANPVQVLVRAVENSAPREDTTRLKRGGISYSLAVDIAPLRRVDDALKNLALAAFSSSFKNKLSAADALKNELIAAANNDSKSFSIKRKDEVERIAKSSR